MYYCYINNGTLKNDNLRLVSLAALISNLKYFVVPLILLQFILYLWKQCVDASRDRACDKALPPGSYGLPFIGETLQFFFGVKFPRVQEFTVTVTFNFAMLIYFQVF